ncbi:MAG: ABC transporter permease [Candidatus Micrarchaeia archaeon]
MENGEIASYALHNLRYKKMRSWLTILGIVIGIAAVVSLITLGESLNKSVQEQFSQFGYDTIYVMPIAESSLSSSFGALPPSAGKLYENDVQRLKRIPEIETIGRLIEERASVSFKGKDITAVVDAVEPGIYEKMTAVEIAEGRFIEDNDRHVVVIGPKIAEESFGSNKKVEVNSYLTINNERFRVIGILSNKGGGLASQGIDIAIFVPFEDGKEIFKSSLAKNEIGWIGIKVREGANIDEVEEKIRFEMDSAHKITDPDKRDYGVLSSKTMQETVGSILSLITMFLGAVASISLIVGGLSIANNMLTNVIQRTHEIGVLKAVGADDEVVMKIFLYEAAAVGGVGGIAGTILGLFAAYLVSFAGIPFTFQPLVALLGIGFAMLIGLVSGYLPAKRAAAMNPVDALRYE